MQTAYSDEAFLLLPEVKSLSKHAIRIIDTSVELRSPIRKMGKQPSQLKQCTLYHQSICNECFALKVTIPSGSLDVQELIIEKYIIKWVSKLLFL